MSDCTYTKVTSVEEALSLAKKYQGNFVFSAGGTDLEIYRKQKLNLKSHVIDLSMIKELCSIKQNGSVLEIGSLVTIEQLAEDSVIQAQFPLIQQAALSIASPVVRMSATVGGNLMVANRCNFYNQSQFWREAAGSCLRDVGDSCLAVGGGDKCFSRNVSDLAPALISMDARISIDDGSDSETIPLLDLYRPDGIKYHRQHVDNSIIRSIRVDSNPVHWMFRKLRRRQSIDFTSLTVAAVTDKNNQTRICINGVSMSPIMLAFDHSTADLEKIQKEARRACKSVDNDFMSLKHRRDMIDVYLAEYFKQVKQGHQ